MYLVGFAVVMKVVLVIEPVLGFGAEIAGAVVGLDGALGLVVRS